MKKYYGVDEDLLGPEKWQASWIWGREITAGNNIMMCVRRTFKLDRIPAESRLYITADTRYRLYINGTFVNRGPARCAPHHQSYDIIDVSPLLKEGKNVMAVRVHHLGTIVDYYQNPRPGLLYQLELFDKDTTVIVSDALTKVKEERGWDNQTPQVAKQQQAFVENFDFRMSAHNWTDPDFDDSNWENAGLQYVSWWPPRQANDKAYARMPPWLSLIPRDLPYLEEKIKPVSSVYDTGECPELIISDEAASRHNPVLGISQRLVQVQPLKSCTIENVDKFLKGEAELVVRNSYPETLYSGEAVKSTWIVFDMGDLTVGYPRLNISAEGGTEIYVAYAPYLVDGKFNPGSSWVKCDRITLSNRPVIWESEELRTFRYIGLLVGNTSKPVRIAEAGMKQTWYPFSKSGSFATNDVFIDKLWNASRKTLDIITHDSYNDNYHERRQYIQTGWYSSRCNYATSGDPYLTRRLLVQHGWEQNPTGKIPMHSPGEPYAGILEADLHFHMTLYDYYMYTGDRKTAEYLLLNVLRSLRALEEMENKDGLIENPPYPYWIDWAPLDRRGINFTLNAWYMMALEQDARLLPLFDMKKEADRCAQKAAQIKRYLKTNFWNAEKKLFASTIFEDKLTDNFDEISNGVAIVTGIADKEQAGYIMNSIIENDKTHVMVQPVLLMYWVIEGLFTGGYGREAIQLLKNRYGNMLQHESGTLWEQWNLLATKSSGSWRPRVWSSTQAEPVYSPDVFKRHLSGIEIMEPGMTEVSLSPKNFGVNKVSAAFPSPSGVLNINQTINKGIIRIELTIPDGMKVKVNTQKSITVNGKSQEPDEYNYVVLTNGSHIVII